MSTSQVQAQVNSATKYTTQTVEHLETSFALSSTQSPKLIERLQDINRVKEKIVDASNLAPELFNSQIEVLVELDELMSQTIDDYWFIIPLEIMKQLDIGAYSLETEDYSLLSPFVNEDLLNKFIKTRRKYVNSVRAAAEKLNENKSKHQGNRKKDVAMGQTSSEKKSGYKRIFNLTELEDKKQAGSLFELDPATWDDYLACIDNPSMGNSRLFFNENYLLIEMGEGKYHSSISDLFTGLLLSWFRNIQKQKMRTMGRCRLIKLGHKGVEPDLVLYLGKDSPRLEKSEDDDSSYINLAQWRVPDLVGEISNTTLPTDINEKKQIYAELGIIEYWVVNVKEQKFEAFELGQDKKYYDCSHSKVLEGLPISLLQQGLEKFCDPEEDADQNAVIEWIEEQAVNLNLAKKL